MNNKNKEIVGSYRFAPGDRTLENLEQRCILLDSINYSNHFKIKWSRTWKILFARVPKTVRTASTSVEGYMPIYYQNPKYYFLFGAVSVSNTYDEKSLPNFKLMITDNEDVKARKIPMSIQK